MAAIAERLILAVLAAAEMDNLVFFGLKCDRTQPSALMGTVTERLLAASATSAPEIAFTGFDPDRVGAAFGNDGRGLGGIGHLLSSCHFKRGWSKPIGL